VRAEGVFDAFQAQAWRIVTGSRHAGVLTSAWSRTASATATGGTAGASGGLLARRLVKLVSILVAGHAQCPLCGRVANWDDHAVNHHVFDAMQYGRRTSTRRCLLWWKTSPARLDRASFWLSAAISGRTPRISYAESTAVGVGQRRCPGV